MDKLATLQQQLQEAEDKKVALQDQVRVVLKSRIVRSHDYTAMIMQPNVAPDQCAFLCAGDRLR